MGKFFQIAEFKNGFEIEGIHHELYMRLQIFNRWPFFYIRQAYFFGWQFRKDKGPFISLDDLAKMGEWDGNTKQEDLCQEQRKEVESVSKD